MQCRFLHGQGWGAWTFVGVACCHSSLYRGVGGTVLCPCMQKPGHSCTMTCMGQDLRTLGICTHRAHGQGTCIAHPSAFNDQWGLKLGPPLQSSWAVQDVALANLYTSVLISILPFIRSWGALLLSCAAWVNMGLLSGRSTAVTLRAASDVRSVLYPFLMAMPPSCLAGAGNKFSMHTPILDAHPCGGVWSGSNPLLNVVSSLNPRSLWYGLVRLKPPLDVWSVWYHFLTPDPRPLW